MISSDFIFNFIEFPNEFLHSGYIFVYFHFLLLLPSAQFWSTADFKQWSKISLGACARLRGTNMLEELIFYYRALWCFSTKPFFFWSNLHLMLAGDAILLLKFLGMKFFLSSILGIETIFMESFKVFCVVLMKGKSSPHTQKKLELQDMVRTCFFNVVYFRLL